MSEFVISSVPARDRVQTWALPRVTNSVHAAKRGSVVRGNPFNFRWALQRCESSGGLIRAASTRYVSAHVNSQSMDEFNFFPAISRSSFCAGWLKIPQDFRISREIYRRIEIKKIKKKEMKTDSILSRELMRSFCLNGRVRHRPFTCGTSTYTRRLYDNGRASGLVPVFSLQLPSPRRPIFPPSHCNPPASRCVCK